MILLRIFLLVLFSPLLLLVKILGPGRHDMACLREGHPEMKEAFAQAHATLSEFRDALASPKPDLGHFTIKAKFPAPGGGSEHCWITELEPRGSGFVGKLDNHPKDLHGLKLGSLVDVSEEMISDWGYSQAGVHRGHFTTRVLLPRMSKSMRKKVEATFGWAKLNS